MEKLLPALLSGVGRFDFRRKALVLRTTMQAEEGYLDMAGGRLHYWKYGAGSRMGIALHGFAEDGRSFQEMAEGLSEDWVIYAIDLPFHGLTDWHGDRFLPPDLALAVRELLLLEQAQTFTAIGYSFGARLWLSTLSEWLPRLAHLVLMAPDGLATRRLLLLDILPEWGREWLRAWFSSPGRWGWLVTLMRRLHLLDDYSWRFLRLHLHSASRRDRLWNTWFSALHFPVDRGGLRRLLRTMRIPVILLLGENDTVVRGRRARRFLQACPHLRTFFLPTDHGVLRDSAGLAAVFSTLE
ncbi:MAG: alpha/beta hydrolase [Lewinellaceae bacterium]|nr:alpha/beta hydrolase [Lewinellaceae bacterium]